MEENDIRLMIGDVKFGSRAVGVLKKNDKILFQKKKTDLNWALPGGAIATLERGKDVVKREFREETDCDVEVIRPLWFIEYFFEFDNLKQHQYIIGYLLDIKDDSKLLQNDEFDGIEEGKNIIYKWINIKDIKNENIKPDYLKEKLLNIKDNFEFIEEEDLK